MVIAGEVDEDVPALMRLLPDGTPDPTFGSAGVVVAKGAYDGAPAWWLSLAFSGSSIVVAGAAENTPPYGTGLGATAVVRGSPTTARPIPRSATAASSNSLARPSPSPAVTRSRSTAAALGARHLARDHDRLSR